MTPKMNGDVSYHHGVSTQTRASCPLPSIASELTICMSLSKIKTRQKYGFLSQGVA